MKRAIQLPYTFVLMNWAAVVGLYHFLHQKDDACREVWTRYSSQTGRSDRLE